MEAFGLDLLSNPSKKKQNFKGNNITNKNKFIIQPYLYNEDYEIKQLINKKLDGNLITNDQYFDEIFNFFIISAKKHLKNKYNNLSCVNNNNRCSDDINIKYKC